MGAAVLLPYLLKAHGALLVAAAVYFGLLRRLTRFGLNRAFLLLAWVFAAAYPALPVPALLPAALPAGATPVALVAAAAAPPLPGAGGPPATGLAWATVGGALYGAGVALLLLRLLGQLLALARLTRGARPARVLGQRVWVLPGLASPFSFGRRIYLDPARHPGPELAAVLRHEQAHVRQAHTLDGLLAQVATALAWANPAAWLLRRAVLDNLEYLADAAALATGLDRRAYQFSLLRLGHVPAGSALVSSFAFPTLKNRVLMMNAPSSAPGQLGRYLLALLLALGLPLGFAAAQTAPSPPVEGKRCLNIYVDAQLTSPADFKALMSHPSSIVYIQDLSPAEVQQIFGLPTADCAGMVVITPQNTRLPAVLALNEKINRVAPMEREYEFRTEVSKLAPTVTPSLAQSYPNARISEVFSILTTRTGQLHYRVVLAEGHRTRNVYFDEQGQVVKN